MPTYRLYQVDAFADRVFWGNPAAVVLLDVWPGDEVLRHIAAETHLPLTAFVVAVNAGAGKFHTRWFAPSGAEVELSGHALLATAHVVWTHQHCPASRLMFLTRTGEIAVERAGGVSTMDLPARTFSAVPRSNEVFAALGRQPSELYSDGRILMGVFDNKRDIHEIVPDFGSMAKLDVSGVAITAPGAKHDFICRFFAPKLGVPEDAASGSVHCVLAPYWAMRLGRTKLSSHQVSKRGGELACQLKGDRVLVSGRCADFMHGTITL